MTTLLFYNGEPTPEAEIRADMSKQGVDKKTVQLFLDTAEFFDTPANFFDESKVKRGQPGNAGQFGPGGGSAAKKSGKSKKSADAAVEKKVAPKKADGEEKAIELGPEAIVDPVARRDAEDAQDREIYAKQGGEALKQHLAKRKALKQAEAKEKESGEGVIDLADYEKSEKAKSGQKKPGDNDAGGSFIGKKPAKKKKELTEEEIKADARKAYEQSLEWKVRDEGRGPEDADRQYHDKPKKVKRSGLVKRALGLQSKEEDDEDKQVLDKYIDTDKAVGKEFTQKYIGEGIHDREKMGPRIKKLERQRDSLRGEAYDALQRKKYKESTAGKVLGTVGRTGKKVVDKVKSLFYNGEPTPIADVRFSLLSEGFDESIVDDWLLTFEVASFADDEDEDRAPDGKFAPSGSGDKTEGDDEEEEDVVTKTAKKVKKTADEVGETAEKAGTAASKGAGDVVDKVKKSAEDIGETVSKTSQQVADAASEETNRLTKPIRDAADYVADSAVGRGVKSGVEKVGKSLSAAGDAASEAATRTGEAISEGASAVKRKAKNAMSRIRSLFYNGEPTPISDVRFSLLDNGFDPAVVDDWLLTFEVAEFRKERAVALDRPAKKAIPGLLFHGKVVPVDTVRNAYLKVGFSDSATEEILASMEVVDFFDESQPRGKDGKWKKGAGGSGGGKKSADAYVGDPAENDPRGTFVEGYGHVQGSSKPKKKKGFLSKLKSGVAGAFQEDPEEKAARERAARDAEREEKRKQQQAEAEQKRKEEKAKAEQKRIEKLRSDMDEEIKTTSARIMEGEDQRGIITRVADASSRGVSALIKHGTNLATLPFDFAGQAKIVDTIGNFFAKEKGKYKEKADKSYEKLEKEYGVTTANLIVASGHLARVAAVAGIGIAATAAIGPAGLSAAGVGGTITALLGGSGKMAMARAAASVMLAGGGAGALMRATEWGRDISRAFGRAGAYLAFSAAGKKFGSEIEKDKEEQVEKALIAIKAKYATLSGGKVGAVPDGVKIADPPKEKDDAKENKKAKDDDGKKARDDSGEDRRGSNKDSRDRNQRDGDGKDDRLRNNLNDLADLSAQRRRENQERENRQRDRDRPAQDMHERSHGDDHREGYWDDNGLWRRGKKGGANFSADKPMDDQVTLTQAEIDRLGKSYAKLLDQSLIEALLADKKVWQELADAIVASGVSEEELLKHDPLNKA